MRGSEDQACRVFRGRGNSRPGGLEEAEPPRSGAWLLVGMKG